MCEVTYHTYLCGHYMTIIHHGCESFYAEDTKCEEVETANVRSDVCCARGCKDCPGCSDCEAESAQQDTESAEQETDPSDGQQGEWGLER
jgi:hypothetical protein